MASTKQGLPRKREALVRENGMFAGGQRAISSCHLGSTASLPAVFLPKGHSQSKIAFFSI